LLALIVGEMMEPETGKPIILRIYRMPSGEWGGRLFVGAREVDKFSGYASTHEVEKAARTTGLYPEYIEFDET